MDSNPIDLSDDDAARHRILQLPTSLLSLLPPKTLPIAQLVLYNLPPISPADNMNLAQMYTTEEPTQDIEGLLPFLAIPSRQTLQGMVSGFDQACSDGKKSLLFPANPEISYPLWILTFWKDVLEAAEAKAKWLRAERWLHQTGQTRKEKELKLQVRGIWSVVKWHGNLPGFASLPMDSLAKLFSSDYLDSRMVDAMLTLLSLRTRIVGDESLVIATTFAEFIRLLPPIIDGVATGPIIASAGGQKYLKKYGLWFQDGDHKTLYSILYRHPNHWTTVRVDFENRRVQYGDGMKWERPIDFFKGLQNWIADHHGAEFPVTDDLPCAVQTDGLSCPVIAVNAIAHNKFGDALWTKAEAKAMRMKAFCDIVKHALSVDDFPSEPSIVDPADSAANILAVDIDIKDELLGRIVSTSAESSESHSDSQTAPAPAIEDPSDVMSDPDAEPLDATKVVGEPKDIEMGDATVPEPSKTSRGLKRGADETEQLEERKKKKVAMTAGDPGRLTVHPLSKSDALPSASRSRTPAKNNKASTASASNIGISASASTARKLREQVKNGTFRATAGKTANFQEECRKWDSDAAFEPTCSQVQCSTCKSWLKMKEPYNTYRFQQHAKQPCNPPPPPPKVNTLTKFLIPSTRPKPKPERLQKILKPCPGLTAEYDTKIGLYLDRAASTGGGARALSYYSEQLFNKDYEDLSEPEKDQANMAQLHGRTWWNDVSNGIMATFSTKCLKTVEIDPGSTGSMPPCNECVLVFTSRQYKTAINKPVPDAKNLRFVPKAYQNTHGGLLFAKFQGLEELMKENNSHSLARRFIQHVLDGDFKNDKVFMGIIEAKILAKTREIKGCGMQNFKHNEDVDALFGLIHTISPRAYREISKHIPLRSEHSIRHKILTSPRFPLGIQDATYQFAQKYCEDYGYPCGAPLSLAVDDTKLFSALLGDPIEVPDVDALHATLDRLEKNPPPMATKLRLWTLQIPLPRVPPLVLAIMPIEAKVKGPQLAEWQIQLMRSLISHEFRITASGGDGAAVERDCQRRLGVASKAVKFHIKHPNPDYPDIVVDLWDLDGNIWVIFQDAKHGRKTFRNNAASGARGLILENHVVYSEQMYTLAMQPDSPMYPRDWKNRDRMDDHAAARLSSADTLSQAALDPTKNLGLVVYLFVFGDLIDAYQSRTLSHHERAEIAIRTRLFLHTWKTYLKKAGYSEARHFISKEAFEIFEILINGILGLIVIHRDHLGGKSCPLLPWFVASEPNEHAFSGLRDVSEDFTLQEAILIVPKLRAKMQAAVLVALDASDFKKQASGYSHTYFTKDGIDFGLLAQYPTDLELSDAYEIAAEENCLWSLLGIHPREIDAAPDPGVALTEQPAPDPQFESLYLNENLDVTGTAESTPAEELQQMIDGLKSVANISRAGDEELEACVMASVALAMEDLAKMYVLLVDPYTLEAFADQRNSEDLPESDPERFAEIQKEIAHAMATQPTAFVALLQGIADKANSSLAQTAQEEPIPPPASQALVDVSSSDLAPLVQLRRDHQTCEERMGVRTYKSSGTYKNPKTGVEKPLTNRQILAQKMQAIVRRDQDRGSSAGLNRTVRWTGTSSSASPAASKTGNSANAELAASGRANEAVKRRRTIFGKVKQELRAYDIGSEIFLARVITMYSKNGGKAGAHSWAPTCDTIGSLSYLLVQLYQHSCGRQFKYTNRNYAALGTLRFAHLPSNSFLFLLPQAGGAVANFQNHVEIDQTAQRIFAELIAEKEPLAKAVASLNTVRRKGKANVNILEMEEEEEMDDPSSPLACALSCSRYCAPIRSADGSLFPYAELPLLRASGGSKLRRIEDAEDQGHSLSAVGLSIEVGREDAES
ncbi:hypothetical protein C8R45DRAFT_1216427 [Mycena sanguinolenta]|nr:hypothetical protein C8R45DRAFT_1216427 [Mycena sanguinolenta]